jgi:hypothetical protein
MRRIIERIHGIASFPIKANFYLITFSTQITQKKLADEFFLRVQGMFVR